LILKKNARVNLPNYCQKFRFKYKNVERQGEGGTLTFNCTNHTSQLQKSKVLKP
jgi:hypothetical protein